MISYKTIVILAMISLIPAASGISLTVSEGNGDGDSIASMDYGAGSENVVDQDIKLNPQDGTMSNYWYFSGPGSSYRSATGVWGGSATTGFSVTGSNAQTYYDFASSNWPYAVASETLSAYKANSISAYAYASSSYGDYASEGIYVYSPYSTSNLYNYNNIAVGTGNEAYVSQGADAAYAPNGYLYAYEYAADRQGDYSYNYAQMNYLWSTYPYFSNWPAAAYATNQYTVAQQSYYDYGYPSYAWASAALSGYGPTYDEDWYYGLYYAGYDVVGQYSYTSGPYTWASNYLYY